MITGQTPTSQEKPQKTNKIVLEHGFSSSDITLNRSHRRSRHKHIYYFAAQVREHLSSHSQSHKKIWGYLLWMFLNYRELYMTQAHIAEQADILRPQANIILNMMNDLNIIWKEYRGREKTCRYSFPSFCKKWLLWDQISNLFGWLRSFRFKPIGANRTQVLLFNVSEHSHADMTLGLGVTDHKINSIPDRASPLPGSDAHESSINLKTSTKGKGVDYEAFARDIGAETDSRATFGTSGIPNTGDRESVPEAQTSWR